MYYVPIVHSKNDNWEESKIQYSFPQGGRGEDPSGWCTQEPDNLPRSSAMRTVGHTERKIKWYSVPTDRVLGRWVSWFPAAIKVVMLSHWKAGLGTPYFLLVWDPDLIQWTCCFWWPCSRIWSNDSQTWFQRESPGPAMIFRFYLRTIKSESLGPWHW